MNLKEYIHKVRSGELDPVVFYRELREKNKSLNSDIFAMVREYELSDEQIKEISNWPLAAAPIVVKDNILVKGFISTCWSRVTGDYIAPYSASCAEWLMKNGAAIIGAGNMDEFAMGSSTESSAFGVTRNPHDFQRVPGWSSGGSAASVAGWMALAALWSDTGGSVRQPASFCGLVGVKPTYGRVSRYGVQAMGSSLDQIGTFTKSVEDAVLLLDSISHFDSHDSTSFESDDKQGRYDALQKKNLQWTKIAIIKQFFDGEVDPLVKKSFDEAVELLKKAGAIVEFVDCDLVRHCVSAYYIVMPAEVSTNLSRFDGIRFGLQQSFSDTQWVQQYMQSVRSAGFWDEAKRRILTGTYVLSSENYESHFLKASHYRQALREAFDDIFAEYDVIIWPTSPVLPWKFGEKSDNPVSMYLADIYTIPPNLTGIPAMSIPVNPVDIDGKKIPVGLHIMAGYRREDNMFTVAKVLEDFIQG